MYAGKCIEMVNYQDKLYQVYRRVNKNSIKEGNILDVRNAWHCDMVLKTKNQDVDTLLFLIEIPDATIVIDEPPHPTAAAIVEG